MDQLVDEVHLFGLLKTSLRQDLVSCHGFPNPQAGAILNWFDPAKEEYLQHIDDWQSWLCSMVRTGSPALPNGIVGSNVYGFYDITELPTHQIGAIHQVAKLFYKWHGKPRRETDMREVKERLREPLPMTLDQFEIEGIRTALSALQPPDLNCVIGRFGPGITSEGFDAYMKWKRLGAIPDVPPNLFRYNPRDPWTPTSTKEGATKIAEVPKSIKCNRIVSSEPAMYMYAQLAVNDAIVRQLHQLFPQHISLDDQERHNQALYRHGACSIDLSDASDHVSTDLVQSVLPQLWPVLARVRSTFACFPDGELVQLRTFAPMGSGVCFSTMTAVICGILRYAAAVVKRETGRSAWFHVYGDDIIVPYWMYDYTISLLSRAGLLVNTRKSCCTQVYRESCGLELFFDMNITPGYIRDPLEKSDTAKIEQLVRRLDELAFPSTARKVVELARPIRAIRWNGEFQRQEVLVRVTSARQKIRSLDGWDGLNRWMSVHSLGPNPLRRYDPPGVASEVWTKPAWRYRASSDYPYLTAWVVPRLTGDSMPPARSPRPRGRGRR